MEKLNKLILKREILRAKLKQLDQQISRLDQEIIRLHSPDELNEPWNLPFSTMLEFGDSAEEKETVRSCVEILKSKAIKEDHQKAFYEILEIINRSVSKGQDNPVLTENHQYSISLFDEELHFGTVLTF